MRKTREALQAEVQATLFQGDLDEETWERLEEALIYADVGARTTAQVVAQLEQEAEEGPLVGGEALTERLASCSPSSPARATTTSTCGPTRPSSSSSASTAPARPPRSASSPGTCSRARPAASCSRAADTFRAAAVEQLELWAERTGCEIVRGPEGSDPGAVAFDAIAAAASAAPTSSSSTPPAACTPRPT